MGDVVQPFGLLLPRVLGKVRECAAEKRCVAGGGGETVISSASEYTPTDAARTRSSRREFPAR